MFLLNKNIVGKMWNAQFMKNNSLWKHVCSVLIVESLWWGHQTFNLGVLFTKKQTWIFKPVWTCHNSSLFECRSPFSAHSSGCGVVTPAHIPPAQHQIPYFYFCEPRPRAMADEVPLIEVRTQTALQQTLLPFEPERFALLHLHRSLQIIYIIHRYDWNVAGVYSFLRARDQDMLSLCCYATRREHVERRTDEIFFLSPTSACGQIRGFIAYP